MIGSLFILIAIVFTVFSDEKKGIQHHKSERLNYLGIARQSSPGQDTLTQQVEWIEKTAKRMNLHKLEIISVTCNGSTFVKKHKKEILKLHKEKGIDYVISFKTDRTGRDTVEGISFFKKLNKMKSITILTTEGEFNYDDPNHRHMFHYYLLIAEHELYQKNARVDLKMNHMLQAGIYPRKNAPFGYIKSKDGTLEKKSWCEEVINYIFSIFEAEKNYSKTAEKVNTKYSTVIETVLQTREIKSILQNQMYIGYFKWGGELLGMGEQGLPHESIKVLSEEKFHRIQNVISEIGEQYSRTTNKGIQTLIDKYGYLDVDYVMKLRPPCPSCHSYNLQDNGTHEMGTFIQKSYICKNKKCKTIFRSPLVRQFKKIHDLSSYKCPNCESKNDFNLTHDGSEIWVLTCEKCGYIEYFSKFCDNKVKKVPKKKTRKHRLNRNRKLDEFPELSDSDQLISNDTTQCSKTIGGNG